MPKVSEWWLITFPAVAATFKLQAHKPLLSWSSLMFLTLKVISAIKKQETEPVQWVCSQVSAVVVCKFWNRTKSVKFFFNTFPKVRLSLLKQLARLKICRLGFCGRDCSVYVWGLAFFSLFLGKSKSCREKLHKKNWWRFVLGKSCNIHTFSLICPNRTIIFMMFEWKLNWMSMKSCLPRRPKKQIPKSSKHEGASQSGWIYPAL